MNMLKMQRLFKNNQKDKNSLMHIDLEIMLKIKEIELHIKLIHAIQIPKINSKNSELKLFLL